MISEAIIAACVSALPYVTPTDRVPMVPVKQEAVTPVYATLPRRKERLSRYERRHPNLSKKERIQFNRMIMASADFTDVCTS